MTPALRRLRRVTIATTLFGLLGTGAALAHGADAGVRVAVVGAPSWSLSPVYHILMEHFQDALAGFGLRYAIRSGTLAAHSLLGGTDYTRAWREQLLPGLRAGVVNRSCTTRPARAQRITGREL